MVVDHGRSASAHLPVFEGATDRGIRRRCRRVDRLGVDDFLTQCHAASTGVEICCHVTDSSSCLVGRYRRVCCTVPGTAEHRSITHSQRFWLHSRWCNSTGYREVRDMARSSARGRAATKPGSGSGDVRRAWFGLVVARSDEVGGAFGDHDGRCMGMAAGDPGHHRGVHHPQRIQAVDA
jgi:hypothetical protein